MTENECLALMKAPASHRPSKPYLGGVIQIHISRACDKSCYSCTQGSNLAGKSTFMTPAQFESAVLSLEGYWGVFGVFGGNPALSPYFHDYCSILQKHVPFQQRGLWCNHPCGKGKIMRETFNPRFSNLNCHLDMEAYEEFKRDWPESMPFGQDRDCRHATAGFVAMKDLDVLPAHPGEDQTFLTKMPNTEENRLQLISKCSINQQWSAMIGVFRGELRAWFCEIAGAQSILHQWDKDDNGEYTYPDTGLVVIDSSGRSPWHNIDLYPPHSPEQKGLVNVEDKPIYWWQLPMGYFRHQVSKHCHECSVPLNGYGELACTESPDAMEQVSNTHANIFRPKRPGRQVQIVDRLEQLGVGRIKKVIAYMQNAQV